MQSRLARRSAAVVVVLAVATSLSPTVHARTLDVFAGASGLGGTAVMRMLSLPKIKFPPKYPADVGERRDQSSSSSSPHPFPSADDRLGVAAQPPYQQQQPKQQQQQQQQQQPKQQQPYQQQPKLQQPYQQQTTITERSKLETTTQDRSIITAPRKPCPEGQRMNPDRVCRPSFVDPEDGE